MLQFFFRRLASLLLSLAGASVLVMFVLEVLPGNAAQTMLGPDAAPEAVQALYEQLGLDQPVLRRYGDWIGGLLRGDMGESYAYGIPASELILESLKLTLPLALLAIALAIAMALCAGIYAAARHNRAGDVLTMGLTQIGIAVPNFWLAILLIMLFAVRLRWFSAGGFPGWSSEYGGGPWPALKALLLPALALAMVQAAMLARMTRSAMLEVLREDYIRTAQAKGLARWQVLLGHALRNALIPVVTVAGLQFANLLAGTIVVENVFQLPGLGRLIFQAIENRDMVVVRNCVLLLSAMVIVVNFLVDLAYAWLDPRIRHTRTRRAALSAPA
ncbi:ABC transporter permease [Vandammella animalimorsus]|uniref:ABC transporter permease n=1 Tax=Vandammella animalimorsus TaxID=2029117 RepID=A0A2A2AGX1_9BURK|nr:ABC transporter permease [Vandammella animalimorsus]PAT37056.1 ABC transporter permease [Vandammella animalimorsus]RMX10640.1 ABC transporter permease [Vandammella animalimorsus]